MYPRLNPKVRKDTSLTKPKLSILQDQNSFQSYSYRENTHANDGKNKRQLPAIRQLSQSNDYCNKYTSSYQSKEFDLFSNCQNQLNLKYGHLKGKRRSQQMSVIFYKQISQQKNTKVSQKRSSSNQKRFNSLRKIEVNMIDKKKQVNGSSQKIQFKQKLQNKNIDVNQIYYFPKKFLEPLQQLKNQVRYQNQEYEKTKRCHNFLPKVIKKGVFFRNKIIEQIITNNIDQWKADNYQDQCFF